MAEADDDFLALDAGADVGLGLVRRFVALLHLEGDLVGAAVLGPAQCADGAGDAAVHVGAGAGDDAAGEGAGVELVLGVEDQRGVHGGDPALLGLLAVQQVQEVAADAVVVGLDVDAPAVVAVVVPVQQHRAQRGHQLVGDAARIGVVVVVLLGREAAEHGHAGAHHVHRVRRRRQLLQRGLQARRQAAQALELGLVGAELGAVGQLAVHQQVGDLLELTGARHVQDVVAAVVQVIAAAAYRAERGVAGGGAGQGNRLLGLEAGGGGGVGFGHGLLR